MNACYFLLTPNCNLTCKYCFQRDGIRSARKCEVSDRETIDQFAVFCRANTIGRVEFFGGEPLLYRETFLYAARALLHEVPGIKLGMVTNGTRIDPEIMRLIEQEGISVLLSLDGKRERHNLLRGGFDRMAPWFERLAATGHTTVAMQVGIVKDLSQHLRFIWGLGFPRVYLNIIQSYDWYHETDIDRFEREYEDAVQAMLGGEGELLCAVAMHRMLDPAKPEPQCGITREGLACDWRGLLYPCHRAPEIGSRFSIGDVRRGILKEKARSCRARINGQCFKSPSARRYPLVSFCPVTVYQHNHKFRGSWNSMFCEMINRKAKVVAKYHYELEEYCATKLRREGRHAICTAGADRDPANLGCCSTKQ